MVIDKIVGLGCDNTNNSMVGEDEGLKGNLKRNYCPYITVNGCFAHLFQLVNKHSFENYNHLVEFDETVNKTYKYFSKSSKKLLDLERWYLLKDLKYHKLLNIFDIRWLSRANSVNNFRQNFPAVLDTFIEYIKDYKTDKKTQIKTKKFYDRCISYESFFLVYVLSDILLLCNRVAVALQSDNY